MFKGDSFLSSIPPVVKNIIIINVLFYLGSIVLLSSQYQIRIEDYLGLHVLGAENFNPAQLVSYLFLHAYWTPSEGIIFSHLFFNMFSLFMFGRMLEYHWGSKRFLTYYMITGIGAGIIQLIVQYFELQDVPLQYYNQFVTVGASGAVFGILLAFGMTFPELELMLLFPPIPIKAKYLMIIYAGLELFMGVANFRLDNVAHWAHLGGMLFGLILILYWRKQRHI